MGNAYIVGIAVILSILREILFYRRVRRVNSRKERRDSAGGNIDSTYDNKNIRVHPCLSVVNKSLRALGALR
jgi:hypothetical protein